MTAFWVWALGWAGGMVSCWLLWDGREKLKGRHEAANDDREWLRGKAVQRGQELRSAELAMPEVATEPQPHVRPEYPWSLVPTDVPRSEREERAGSGWFVDQATGTAGDDHEGDHDQRGE